MNRFPKREPSGGLRPLRLRVAALLCVMLIGVVSVAQAAHIHGQWLPNSAAQVSAHTSLSGSVGEDVCPLCMAMHSAMPATGFAAVVLALPVEAGTFALRSRKPRSPWYFAAFSRPPPEFNL